MKANHLNKPRWRRHADASFWRRMIYLAVVVMIFFPTLIVQSSSHEKGIAGPAPIDLGGGYWRLYDKDQSDAWQGDNFHGLASSYMPIIKENTIGADYTQYIKEKLNSNLRGTCTWNWENGAVPSEVVPGINYPFTMAVDANATGTGFVGGTVNGYTQTGAGNGVIAFAQVYLDVGGQGARKGHQETSAVLSLPAGQNYGEKWTVTQLCQIDIVEVQRVYIYEYSEASCLATLTLPDKMAPNKEFTPVARVINNQTQPVKPQEETWSYNGDSTGPMIWDGKAGTVEYEYVCPNEAFARKAVINIPPLSSCSATITLPIPMKPDKPFIPKAVVVDKNDKPVKPENERWSYNGKSSPGEMVWDGKAAKVEYQYTCSLDQQPGSASINIPPALCKPPYDGDADQKLQEVIKIYMRDTAKGVYSSGSKNNAMSLIPGNGNLAVYRCGGYQGEVIKLLEKIKFNADSCVAGLLDEWDYGPIQAWFGGHQAVVIYPAGKDWVDSGYVLDPWMNQKPEVYTIQAWAKMWQKTKNLGGIGPSTADWQPNFPTHGGSYEDPTGKKYTAAEEKYIKGLPKTQADMWANMDVTQKRAFLRRHQNVIKNGNKFIAQSPLTAYVMDAEGKKTGMVNGSLMHEIEDVNFSSFPLQDGTLASQIEYPSGQTYSLVLQGTGNGEAHVMSSFISPEDEFADPQSYMYPFTAVNGQEYTLGPEAGAGLTSKSGTVEARLMDASDEQTILALPDIDTPQVSFPDTSAETGSDPVDNSTLPSQVKGSGWVLVVGGFGAVAAAGLAAVAVGAVLVKTSASKAAKTGPQPSKYILELQGNGLGVNKNSLEVKPRQQVPLYIQVWRIPPDGIPVPAPEATIQVWVPPSPAGLVVSPGAGQGRLECVFSIPKPTLCADLLATVTASAAGTTARAQVKVSITPVYDLKLEWVGSPPGRLQPGGKEVYARACLIAEPQPDQQSTPDALAGKIFLAVQGPNCERVKLQNTAPSLQGPYMQAGFLWIPILFSQPDMGTSLQPGYPILVASCMVGGQRLEQRLVLEVNQDLF